ncbi:isoprenyl transferase [Sediminitomix flava]|uniref:Isoprenyl transferase n=1 Tax=Sediminitomix flava TaxID=379075 RepID=A0A315ZFQ1_SEDFL|nr:isoprenyl transferase [Sediminitomix flava]PWJ44416.1 undecaprenyl pyrophosphate synthetase [Sediminitomix flava]
MKEKIDLTNIPEHIAVIMDGNGRWAKKQGARRVFGHQSAIKAVREVTEGCGELGVKYLTLFAFSTENWNRPKLEVDALMQLLVKTIDKEISSLHENKVKLSVIGDLEAMPRNCQKSLKEAMSMTANNTGLNLILALNYSGKWDMLNAIKNISKKVAAGLIEEDAIDLDTITENLSTRNIPDPELLIRTSGEQRISNFMLWQLAYSELYFTETLWPDFRKHTLHEALYAYQNRERRFGMTSEQVSS